MTSEEWADWLDATPADRYRYSGDMFRGLVANLAAAEKRAEKWETAASGYIISNNDLAAKLEECQKGAAELFDSAYSARLAVGRLWEALERIEDHHNYTEEWRNIASAARSIPADGLWEEVRKYMWHMDDCGAYLGEGACTCGLVALLNGKGGE